MADEDMIGCPDCGTELEADWVEVSSLRELPGTSKVLARLTCPSGPLHDLTAAYEGMRSTRLVHRETGAFRSCPVHRIDHWRRQGWYPLDDQFQTPTEMVYDRVRKLGGGRV